jgi:hypothetical protein
MGCISLEVDDSALILDLTDLSTDPQTDPKG